jgi:hypothetical protein
MLGLTVYIILVDDIDFVENFYEFPCGDDNENFILSKIIV